MRSLQRLRYVHPPPEQEVRRIHNAERRNVRRRERGVWGRRIGVALRVLLICAFVALVGWALWGGRVLVDGLVQADVVVVRAPARVRVAEVLCAPGQRCEPGTPLLRLESTAPPEQRRVLELALERHGLRLALAEAGGELGETDLARRGDRVAQAEREAALAEADREVAAAAVVSLERQRVSRELELRGALALRQGEVAALDQRVAEGGALVARARAQTELAEFDAQSRTELVGQGVVAERERVSALAARGSSLREVDALEASVRAHEEEREAALAAARLAAEGLEAELFELDARLVEARTRESGARRRRDLWREVVARQRELGATAAAGEGLILRELELELLRVERAEALARLAEFDRLHGATVVRAEAHGVVERVFVRAGMPVEVDEPLVRYFDPTRLRVIAYLSPGDGALPQVGQGCRVLPPGRSQGCEGRVERVDEVWGPLPGLIAPGESEAIALRLAVHVEVSAFDQIELLGPNQRVRVLFDGPRPERDEPEQAAIGR